MIARLKSIQKSESKQFNQENDNEDNEITTRIRNASFAELKMSDLLSETTKLFDQIGSRSIEAQTVMRVMQLSREAAKSLLMLQNG